MINKKGIILYFKHLCELSSKKLSREEYRKLKPEYSSSMIEKIWGNWTNFISEVEENLLVSRNNIKKTFSKNVNRIIITHVNDGSNINFDFYYTLLNYCNINNAELGILWGKSIRKNKTFSKEEYYLLSPYLATEFNFEKDSNCIAKDFLIPITQKNPLLNLDKLSTNIKTIIVGSTKQYLDVLPYKQYTSYRIACSTGTLSLPDYKDTISGQIDNKYHKHGAVLLEWNEKQKRYVIRNLIFNDGCICDLDTIYYKDKTIKQKTIPGMVLGDLHLPDEDECSMKETKEFIKKYKPEYVILHDVASWNSICHHNFGKCLFNAQNITDTNTNLTVELKHVVYHLRDFVKDIDCSKFKVVNSNHDAFIEKWLDTGEFVKDKMNAVLGAKLFIKYTQGFNILDDCLPENVEFLKKNESFEICGFELSEHGDAGISGASGSPNGFNKTFENCIVGHTHSCSINGNTIYVGTLSKLVVNYNQKGMTKWIHANAIIHKNNTAQLIIID